MIGRARGAVAAVVLCVLASAATASAECAWVLWEHTGTSAMKSTSRVQSEPVAAHPTKPECERAVATALAGYKSNAVMTVNVDKEHNEAFVSMKSKDGSMLTTFYKYVCLPDTIDPRGPKGK